MATTTSALPAQAIETLAQSMRGEVVAPEHAEYDDARRLYNAMIDKRPAAIARCVDVADVIACVGLAAAEGFDVAVRGGGHNGGGLGSVDEGLVIDLSLLRGVRVDPETRTVTVAGGTTLGEVDHATHAFGLAVPAGIISSTGVGGLTLGGGLGHLTRTYGLTIDNLIGADVVLADGSLVRADENEHADLFWALRGGGGNFGVVTSFTFQARPVSTVVAGPMLWPLDQAAEALSLYTELMAEAPEELNGFFAFLTVPPAPPFPEDLHLQKMGGVVWCYVGATRGRTGGARSDPGTTAARSRRRGERCRCPRFSRHSTGCIRRATSGTGAADFVESIPARGDRRPPRVRVGTADMEVDDASLSRSTAQPGASQPMPPPGAIADARFAQVIVGVDPDPANAAAIRDWTVGYWEALHPYAAAGAYSNFLMDEGRDRVRASYGANYDRLAGVKRSYDPDNLFHVNQNIEPA